MKVVLKEIWGRKLFKKLLLKGELPKAMARLCSRECCF